MIANPLTWGQVKAILSRNQVSERDCLQMLSEIREDDERAEAVEAGEMIDISE